MAELADVLDIYAAPEPSEVDAGKSINLMAQNGGTSVGVPGNINLIAGYANVENSGGEVLIRSGEGNGTGAGGLVTLQAGTGGATGTGGAININAGASGETSGDGGPVSINAGFSSTGVGGDVVISPGSGGTAMGHIRFVDGLEEFADDAAAEIGGVPLGGLYRTASIIKVRVA